MGLIAKFFSLLLLSVSLVRSQDAPQPPDAPPAESKEVQVEPVQKPQVDQPDQPVEPAVEATAEVELDQDTEPPRERGRNQRRGNRNFRPQTSRTVFGEHIVIKPGDSIHDIVLVGGSLDVQGEVERDVVAIGASVTVSGDVGGGVVIVGGKGKFSGHVDEDVVVVLGSADVTESARLDRDTVFVGGPFTISTEASIGGERITIPIGDFLPQIEWLKAYIVRGPLLGRWLTFHLVWPWAVAGTFLAIYLGLLLAFPAAARAVLSALEERPVTSLFTGLLTLILFAPLTFLLVITVAGILVVPFLKISLILALLFGKVGVLCFLGRGIGRASGASKLQVPFLAFVLGAVILTLSYAIPLFGIFAWAMATVLGLGGAVVALSRTFAREEASIPPTPVLLSTVRPAGTYGGATTGIPAMSAPISGAGASVGAATSTTSTTAVPPITQSIGSLGPQDTVLLARAGFWKRFLASLLDLFLIGVVVAILPVIGPALFIPVAVVYFIAMWTWKGTTIGGLILSQRIVRTDGRPITFSIALVRSLLSLFSLLVLFLGFLWAAWDREKQTWHDKIAGTVVVQVPRDFGLF